ncbi:DUF1934 domain-containing protein [Cohnella sp. LGH]|uniref:Uncharacterized beta-barrel protein YwiB (DUF1934 family) n=1 Tax=Cohnella phaseoli TaxID=456490 RepID=A0A3D9HU02_9BACL|nr:MULTISPECIES: DUF1934 domain-containing protein [Cohnella]QTH43453.1 DUF1934 domain-containing protein [Cohnella sp. LGH]RED52919.1 uncharacterized beta-barrel protein YwiB (DUF1934 family) [Cohnella phaseoli]
MPDKRKVRVGFRSWQQDGGVQKFDVPGELFRLKTGWALTYVEKPDDNGVEASNTLFIHSNGLQLRRRGSIFFEQQFRRGELAAGKLETPYGLHAVQALTSQLDSELSDTGGRVEWSYELHMQDQQVGSFRIRLDIREE